MDEEPNIVHEEPENAEIIAPEEPNQPDIAENIIPELYDGNTPRIEDDNRDDDDGSDDGYTLNMEMDTKYGNRTSQYELRPRRPHDYSHLHTTFESIVMTQHNMKQGIKIFGDAGVAAVFKEIKQIHERNIMNPIDFKQLSVEEKKATLPYLMFLKEKCNGSIKGRGCTDGRRQWLHTAKEDSCLPTVAIESVMISCMIDAKERRDVATVDIPGAFMQADIDEVVHVKFKGTMAELLVKLDPNKYEKFIEMERWNNDTICGAKKGTLWNT